MFEFLFQLSADAERLMTVEYRNNKISKIKEEIPDADNDECLAALQSAGWDINLAIRTMKIDKLSR